MFTVYVPMYSLAVFDDVEASSPEEAIRLIKEKIEAEGDVYSACDRQEEHMDLATALKDDSEFPKEITAESDGIEEEDDELEES